jgi:hypothetical protein
MDGTFDQLKPIDYLDLLPHGKRFSFDLSAATDRLPIELQKQILSLCVSTQFASQWAEVLVGRSYYLKLKNETKVLSYSVGQPMGALSSWGMLALTHHVIVQVAALRVGFSELFLNYALLGDDICIADEAVAMTYLEIMNDLGVEINLSKSLVSSISCIEFAKRWKIGKTDVSPASPSLIVRLLNNFNYLPVLLLDLMNRGVNTIGSPEILKFRPTKFKKLKKNILFSLIPFFDVDFVK